MKSSHKGEAMQDEKKHDAERDMPEKHPTARERYAKERKALLAAAGTKDSGDPLLDAQLMYDILPLGWE